MNLFQHKSGLLSVIAIFSIMVAASYLFADESNASESVMISFANLSDADVDMILAVKAEMHAENSQQN